MGTAPAHHHRDPDPRSSVHSGGCGGSEDQPDVRSELAHRHLARGRGAPSHRRTPPASAMSVRKYLKDYQVRPETAGLIEFANPSTDSGSLGIELLPALDGITLRGPEYRIGEGYRATIPV